MNEKVSIIYQNGIKYDIQDEPLTNEVEKLKEDINTYRISLKKVYGVAKTASSLSEKVKSLTEELDSKNKQLKSLHHRQS